MNFTPLPAHLLSRHQTADIRHHNVGILTKAMVGVAVMLFVVLGTFTMLLFQGPKTNSRASGLPPTPPFVIPTIFIIPSDTTTPSGTMNK